MLGFILASLLVLQINAFTTNYVFNLTNSGFQVTQNGTLLGGFNPTISANVGDTLSFTVTNSSDFSGSPVVFSIHTVAGGGTGNNARYSTINSIGSGGGSININLAGAIPTTLFYVSESNNGASGQITITGNCFGLPGDDLNAGNCTQTNGLIANGTTCKLTCASGTASGDLTATCINGAFSLADSTAVCTGIVGPTPSPSPSPDNNNNGNVEYDFTLDGSSTNNCDYLTNTVLPNLDDYLKQQISGLNNIEASSTLTHCDNNDNNRGSTFTFDIFINGTNADNVVQSDGFFANLLELQLQSDNSVTVDNVSVHRSFGFFVQASVLALLSVGLTALLA